LFLIFGDFFFFGFKNGFFSNEHLTFTGFMIGQLIPIMVGNYFRSKSEALLIMKSVSLEQSTI
jgi:hypothetical protein